MSEDGAGIRRVALSRLQPLVDLILRITLQGHFPPDGIPACLLSEVIVDEGFPDTEEVYEG